MKNKKQDGLIKEVILVIVALITLKYIWDIDLIGYLESPVEKAIDWIITKFR
jgi:hypothetical protein